MDSSTPNDSAYGGCLNYYFTDPVNMLDFGILDIDEGSNLQIAMFDDSDNTIDPAFESPGNIGDNVRASLLLNAVSLRFRTCLSHLLLSIVFFFFFVRRDSGQPLLRKTFRLIRT